MFSDSIKHIKEVEAEIEKRKIAINNDLLDTNEVLNSLLEKKKMFTEYKLYFCC